MLALGQLLQIQVMDSASDKILKVYADECLRVFDHFVKLAQKGLKMHFVLCVYKDIRSGIEISSK